MLRCVLALLSALPFTVVTLSAAEVSTESQLKAALARHPALIELAAGTMLLTGSIQIPPGAPPLEIRGHASGSTLKVAAAFKDRAAIIAQDCTSLRLTHFSLEGNRTTLASNLHLPPSDVAFRDYYPGNGILVVKSKDVVVKDVKLRNIAGFPILVSASSNITIDSVDIQDSGTLNAKGRNNTTGGILIEEGSAKFSVTHSRIHRITGNAIWTHSNYTSPRNMDGVIADNVISEVARDAIQVGHAGRVRVERNRGSRIGYPQEQVDWESHGIPVALDTAGDVDHSSYSENHFTDVNGQCIDLDGFHDGAVTRNSCINKQPLAAYPFSHYAIVFGNNNIDMTSKNVTITDNVAEGFAYGAVFLIGQGHRVTGNRFINVNAAHCTGDMTRAHCNYAPEQPDMLRSGIYLSNNGGRPATTEGNVIEDNLLDGFGMDRWCVTSAPAVNLEQNTISNNRCVARK